MRDTDPKQDVPGLVPKIEKPPMPQQHRKVNEGVWKAPDGKLYTNAPPPPPAPAPPIWEVWRP